MILFGHDTAGCLDAALAVQKAQKTSMEAEGPLHMVWELKQDLGSWNTENTGGNGKMGQAGSRYI